jgi:hypothetical protein
MTQFTSHTHTHAHTHTHTLTHTHTQCHELGALNTKDKNIPAAETQLGQQTVRHRTLLPFLTDKTNAEGLWEGPAFTMTALSIEPLGSAKYTQVA